MGVKKFVIIFLLILCCVDFISAAHWISGAVEDALDGENANGKIVSLWNPIVGTVDNITDIVGTSGNSGYSKIYMMDCELLSGGCGLGSILSLKIFGDSYVSWVVNVTVSTFGYDLAENLSLNSPPNVSLSHPVNFGNISGDAHFNCSFFDYDNNLDKIELWGNWSGGWNLKDSISSGFENGFNIFNETLTEGSYKWNCYAEDKLGIGKWGSLNNSFFADTTLPNVWNIVPETNRVCGFGFVNINCSASDNLGVDEVIIEVKSPSNSTINYSANFVGNNVWSVGVFVNEVGNWDVKCFAIDIVDNLNSSNGESFEVLSGNVELRIVDQDILFDKKPSIEDEIINISINVSNDGCFDSGNFSIGFNDNDGNFENVTTSIESLNFLSVSVLWKTKIGLSNISVFVDSNDDYDENDENDNFANNSIYLKAWQDIYGNVSLDKVLSSGKINMSLWVNENGFNGCIFVADSEANIDWLSLKAIGRTKDGGISSGDFSEIDSGLGMESFNDSVSILFNNSEVGVFRVFQHDIENVPFINSSDNGNFITGILWDSGDSENLEYDSIEKEDIVFVSKINRKSVGSYGNYDYEISVPSKLRNYDSSNASNIYLYYDLN